MRSLLLSITLASTVLAQAQNGDLATTTPLSVETLFKNGEEAYRTGAYAKAIGLFDQVLAKDGDHINAYLQRGFCNSIQQNYTAAVADFTEVIKRKNDHLWAYTSRGSAYNRLGKADLAMRDFDTVLALDPKDQEAYNNRGWSKKTLGDLKGACNDWKTSKKLGNGEARIILTNNRCK